MHLRVAILLLFGVTLVPAHPRSACRDDLMQVVNKIAMGVGAHVKRKMAEKSAVKKFACFDAMGGKKAKEQAMNGMECLIIEVSGPILQALMKSEVQDKAGIQKTWLAVQRCSLKYGKDEVLNADGTFNFDNFKKSMSEVGTGTDAKLVRDLSDKCIEDQRDNDANKNIPAEISLSGYMACFFSNVISECQKKERTSEAKMIIVAHKINSYYKEGECPVKVPPMYEKGLLKCLDLTLNSSFDDLKEKIRSFTDLADMGGDNFRGAILNMVSRMKVENLIGLAMTQAPKMMKNAQDYYWDKILFFGTCIYTKWGMLKPDGKTLDYAKMDYTKNIDWTGYEEKRTQYGKLLGKCYDPYMTGKDEWTVDQFFSKKSIMALDKILWECVIPGYTDLCGWKNELSNMVTPMANENYMSRLIVLIKANIMDIKEMVKPMVKGFVMGNMDDMDEMKKY